MPEKLAHEFYTNSTLSLARQLLGKRLVRAYQGQRISGRIMEVEAYLGENDEACHASCGPTHRNAPMYGPPGHTYVYLIYGMYHCLNIVTESIGSPAAILIRALQPIENIALMQDLRGHQHPERDLARGPGRLCQALAIDLSFNNLDLSSPQSPIWIEHDIPIPNEKIAQSPRIGVRGDTKALTAPWRYYIYGSKWISGTKKFNAQKH